jgi:hypothetical protein
MSLVPGQQAGATDQPGDQTYARCFRGRVMPRRAGGCEPRDPGWCLREAVAAGANSEVMTDGRARSAIVGARTMRSPARTTARAARRIPAWPRSKSSST